jgi:hypothetical protein
LGVAILWGISYWLVACNSDLTILTITPLLLSPSQPLLLLLLLHLHLLPLSLLDYLTLMQACTFYLAT